MGGLNCKCGQKLEENSNQYQFDQSAEETIFNHMKEKLEPLEITIEKVDRKTFEEFTFSPELKELFEEYDEKINEYAIKQDQQIFNMLPIKLINNKTGAIDYYQGGVTIDGFFTGKGTRILKDQLIYYGNFKNDEYNGKGLMILNQQDYIFGDWVNGVCTGKGILKIKNKLEYEGEFLNNKKNGYGIEKYENGSRYEGQFKNNIKSGKGKYILNTGDYYDGNFENDLYNGYGLFKWVDEGREYRGEFKNGINEGKGCTYFKDGSLYDGTYKAGLRHGHGTYSWPNGKKIIGNWINNKLHGIAYFEMDGEKYNITYRFGKVITIQKANMPPNGFEENTHSSSRFLALEKIETGNFNNYVCALCNKAIDNPQKCKNCSTIYCPNCIIDKLEGYTKCCKCGGQDYMANPDLLQEEKEKI